jgi:hypothetical protein
LGNIGPTRRKFRILNDSQDVAKVFFSHFEGRIFVVCEEIVAARSQNASKRRLREGDAKRE